MSRSILTLGLYLMVAAPGSSAGTDETRFAKVTASIRDQMEQDRVSSVAVAVAKGKRIVWEEAFGWADREHGIAASPHTMYSLASVTKPMTATALMVLIEQGALELDRPINEYLGEAAVTARVGQAESATVRRVINHTAGLPLHHHFFPVGGVIARPPMEETIQRYGNLVSEPGKRFQYSNLGYGVLEHAIKQVSGRSYAEFMREAVFEPLGLEHTAVVLTSDEGGERAERYSEKGLLLPFYDFDHRGASAVFSCVRDLVEFGLFHLGGNRPAQEEIVSHRGIRKMQRPSSRRADGRSYGLGWDVWEHPSGRTVVGHGGGMPGASASLLLVPSIRLAVAVVANARTDLPDRVSAEILNLYLPADHFLESARSWDSGMRLTFGPGRRSRRLPKKLAGTWKGGIETTEATVPLVLTVTRTGGIGARLGEHTESPLRHIAFLDGYLTALLIGHYEIPGLQEGPSQLRFVLKKRRNRLNGAVTAASLPEETLPRAVSFWVDLERR